MSKVVKAHAMTIPAGAIFAVALVTAFLFLLLAASILSYPEHVPAAASHEIEVPLRIPGSYDMAILSQPRYLHQLAQADRLAQAYDES